MENNRPEKKSKAIPAICLVALGLIVAEATAMLALQIVNTFGSGQGDSGSGGSTTSSYTITWLNDDGTVLEVDNGVAKGATPTYDGGTPTKPDSGLTYYTFNGWNHEVVGAVADTTYVATYLSAHHDATVTFDMGGHGTQITPLSATYNGHVVKPTDPTEEGFFFDGWYAEPSLTIAWNFETDKVTSDVTLYGKWILCYSVTFENEYGDPVASQSVPKGGKIVDPGEPENLPDNISFTCWADDETYEPWNFNTMTVNKNITLVMYYSEGI